MSRIIAAEIYVIYRQYDRIYFNSALQFSKRQIVLVRLVAEDGLEGWGECWNFDTDASGLTAFLKSEILPNVIGIEAENRKLFTQNISRKAQLSGRYGITAAALSAVEIALWDIAAQVVQRPLFNLLGADHKERIPVYASGGLYGQDLTLTDLETELNGYVEAGFDKVKIKFGAVNFAKDKARLKVANNVLGRKAQLLVDATFSLDRQSAETWLPILSKHNVKGLQSPFPPAAWNDMAWLNGEGMPVIGIESECRYEIFYQMLNIDALGLIQFSPIAVGGISASIDLIRLAAEFGKPVTLQCSSSGLAYLTSLHIAAAFPNVVASVELHQVHDTFYEDLPISAVHPVNGKVELPNFVGIGLVPQQEKLPEPVAIVRL